ncbi:flagellar export chaperone FliS [Novosphingopyxis sp.]|uniref:flagellar export chaperone FliS n=1 Tax=Novosphingopyxis sp. TaxID=2709690 RepID=UPI003B5AC5E5
MYYAAGRAMAQSYGAVDKTSRIAAASPHELVEILFEQLLLRIDRAVRCVERGDMAGMFQSRAKASDILNALDESLDFERGGEIATALAIVYREASNRINEAQGDNAGAVLISAREIVAEISEAWTEIGKR